jgi:radical SAM superfamily enzyme YgiQ (UPF0313 family)
MLEELTEILLPKTLWKEGRYPSYKKDFISVEVGIETGSVRIMRELMPNKAKPYSIEEWPELVVQAMGVMNDHAWHPLATLMTGLPDETEDDTLATLELLDDLKGINAFFTPLLFIPLEDCLLRKSKVLPLDHLTQAQWDFLSTCWNYNVGIWMPDDLWTRLRLLLGSVMVYYLYYRWKHGSKVARHVWKVSGFPEDFWPQPIIRPRVVGGCDPALCAVDEDREEGEPVADDELMGREGRLGESA